MDRVEHARQFALSAHGEQQYGEQPYSYHLDCVAELLYPYGEEAQVIGYLHDCLEDTAATYKQLEAEFGPLIAAAVWQVTDPPHGNRGQRKEQSHRILALTPPELHLALIVKAADRLANLRCCHLTANARKLKQYRTEHPAFRKAAYRPGLCDPLWEEIDSLVSTSLNSRQLSLF